MGEWKLSKTPPPKGKIRPWVIKLKKNKPSKTDNKVNTKTTSKCSKVSQGKSTTYYFLLSIQLITKHFFSLENQAPSTSKSRKPRKNPAKSSEESQGKCTTYFSLQ